VKKKIIISGTGCALADNLYGNINFSGANFTKYLSKTHADGGLSPGKLVFTEEFEKFANKKFKDILSEITEGKSPESVNIGGPSIVALVHASQLLFNSNAEINFYGALGKDRVGDLILDGLHSINVNFSNYKRFDTLSPFTDVFSDPAYDQGRGERVFVNNIGAAREFKSEYLDKAFFSSDITAFGGTALVPKIHDNLTELLAKANENNCFTLVNTVYDFRNEKLNPSTKWPLVDNDQFDLIDLLIMDNEEALKISGQVNIEDALRFFIDHGANGLIITQGADPVIFFSAGTSLQESPVSSLPISNSISNELANTTISGDTTGCGDNFVGGVLASLAWQMSNNKLLNLHEGVKWGIVSGGCACFYYGGVFKEVKKGQKHDMVSKFYNSYQSQIQDV